VLTNLNKVANGKLTHVPYRGGALAVTAVMAGEIPFALSDTGAAAALLADRRVRGLAISGSRRSPTYPDIPALAETDMPNRDMNAWIVLVAPKGTPKAVADKLNGAIQGIMKDPEFRSTMLSIGQVPIDDLGTVKLDAFIADEVVRWRKVMLESGIELQ
jgi:tripartite-type tricarboxylate transporter receptor subunit TctC